MKEGEFGGMKFFSGGPEDLLRLLEHLKSGGGGDCDGAEKCGCGKTHKKTREVKLDAADMAVYRSLIARNEALKKGYARAQSKLTSDSERMWADLKDKHQLHGIASLHINEENEAVEVLE